MRLVESDVPPHDVISDGGEGSEPYVSVHIGLTEDDGRHLTAAVDVCAEDDEAVADALVQCLRGVAALRGSGLQMALARRMGGAW